MQVCLYVYILFSFSQEKSNGVYDTHGPVDRTSKLKAAAKSPTPYPVKTQPQQRAVTAGGGRSPPVQLLHLLYGIRSLQDLGGRRSCRPLPRRGSVYMIHVEDPAVAVDARLPV